MASMSDLLRRWEKLEPGRCRQGEVLLGDGWWVAEPLGGASEGHNAATIQAAVQEAIRERGLNFTVYGYHTAKRWSDAAVVWEGGVRYRAEGESDAINLLSAYLQALESL